MSSYSRYPWATVTAIEDPVTGLMIDFGMFLETYRPLLESLDGLDTECQVETWLEPSPLNHSHLRFVSDDLKMDWIELAICESCIPSLREIQEGEDLSERLKRMSLPVKAPSATKVKKGVNVGRDATGIKDQLKRINDVTSTIRQLTERIITHQAAGKDVAKLQTKLERTTLILNKLTNVTV